MRTLVLTLIALAFLGPAGHDAFAEQFAFDPHSSIGSNQHGSVIPVAIVAIVSAVGSILILLERRKAKGIWFSNSERLR